MSTVILIFTRFGSCFNLGGESSDGPPNQHPIETPTKRNNTDQGRTYSVRPSLEREKEGGVRAQRESRVVTLEESGL